ncbi:MAG: glycosyltransferase family 4 protein [Alphaproteobacteria bacterium]|nr:glycosyltransferase family 4 protein [Alphaproteobacteria bacterium]
MTVIVLEKRWGHHTKSGGYDHLGKSLNAHRVQRVPFRSPQGKIVRKAWEYFFSDRVNLFDYQLGDRIAEEKAFWLALATGARIVHVLYGDEQLNILLRRASLLPGHLVATFHVPAELTRERFEHNQKEALSKLSGAVVVASTEVRAFAAWLGPQKVMYVPHGIDTMAFPIGSGNDGRTMKLVFVGENLRDFEVAHRVADRCARERLNVTFDVVGPSRGFFCGCDNVQLHSNISEDSLVALYQGADAMFLPVTNATANNAILESLACGTPVISTDVGGIPDYVNEDCGWLLPLGDSEAAFQCIKRIAENRKLARAKRSAARTQAERFSWQQVAAQIEAGYQRLLAGGNFAEWPNIRLATGGGRLLRNSTHSPRSQNNC